MGIKIEIKRIPCNTIKIRKQLFYKENKQFLKIRKKQKKRKILIQQT